ncbi:MAG: hypothetical protein KatS3mg123_1536 [Burkholderiales bacterium]|nr:MAG: hypothetical protein KatS3mg123_1536 [Burkholderiales bacterium]
MGLEDSQCPLDLRRSRLSAGHLRQATGDQVLEALADVGANDGLRQRFETQLLEHGVCRHRQVIDGVEQGPVEIQNDRAHGDGEAGIHVFRPQAFSSSARIAAMVAL